MEEKKGIGYKLLMSIICGIISLLLALYAYKVDNLYNLYVYWSIIFPLLIARTFGRGYTLIAGGIGVFMIPFCYTPSRGYANIAFGGILLLWLILISIMKEIKPFRDKWYEIYIATVFLFLISFWTYPKIYLFLAKKNPAPWQVGATALASPNSVSIQYLNIMLTIIMLVGISEVLLELPIVRLFLNLKEEPYSNYNYKYVGVLIVGFIIFLILDALMDKAYSANNGIHISFIRISTGEGIKMSIMLAASSLVCKFIMVSSRKRRIDEAEIQKNQEEIELLNKQLENKVELQTKQLSQAYADLEAYSYTVSHELKTPIREIETYVEFIEKDNEEVLLEESKEDLKSIKKICGDTIRLIQSMMEYAKVGYQILNIECIDMKQVVEDCFNDIMKANTERNIELDIYELGELYGDRFLVKQMVFNIISNAVKYSDKTEKARIIVGRMCNEEEVTYYFNDNGVGFKEEYSNKLFGMFDRLHNDSEYEGSGIGLATVKRIVQKHEGKVAIQGRLGRGCTVFLIFPTEKTR